MSLWGKYDQKPQTNTATATVAVTATTGAIAGVNTKFDADLAVGDFLFVGGHNYVITAVTSNTVAAAQQGADAVNIAIPGAQANANYVISEKPLFVAYAEANNAAGGNANAIYGVSADEIAGTGAGVKSVTVTAAGSGFTSRPTVTFTGGGGTGATATATAGVVTITVGTALDSDAGTGYANGDVITLDDGTRTVTANAVVTTGASNTSVVSLTLGTGGSYTALPGSLTGANTSTSGSGTGLLVDVAFGANAVTVTASGNNYTSSPSITWGGNTASTGTTATVTRQGSDATGGGIAHTGWVRKTVGTGGRAGRVHYEVLVAGGISGDATDDDNGLPE